MAKRSKNHGPSAPFRFQVGDRVRVKPGRKDPEYDDLPLGGWAGTVTHIDRYGMVTIAWSDETLANIHPVVKKRCKRDGKMFEKHWLEEADLEPDSGGPLRMEQPQVVTPRPLSKKDPDDRVRMVFGLTSDELPPPPDDESLETYYRYLFEHLRFPFPAEYDDYSLFEPRAAERVKVKALAPEGTWDREDGIFCEVPTDKGRASLPLANLQLRRSDPNYRLVDDYIAWFRGELAWEEDDEYDDEDEDGYQDEDDDEDGYDEQVALDDDRIESPEAFLRHVDGASWPELAVGAIAVALTLAPMGAVIGSAVATMNWAIWGAINGAVLFGLFCAFVLPPNIDRSHSRIAPRYRRIFSRGAGALAAALYGAVAGVMVVALVGALAGALAGYLIKRRWGTPRIILLGDVVGGMAGCGVIAQAIYLNHAGAIAGLLIGAAAGAVAALPTMLVARLAARVLLPSEATE